MGSSLPFLTLPDPLVSGEGALDPLGLAMIGDNLANLILPGLRARMSRPRFVTAIAVSAAVCEGLEDRFAADNISPAYLVFEWLVVEAFLRAGKREATVGTPGTQKAQEVRDSGDVMCARTYLRTPSVFGFHGVYKPLARHIGIVDDDLRLSDNGWELLNVWQLEQGLGGFLESSVSGGPGRAAREALRSAVIDGLSAGYVKRGGGWQGWNILAEHLSPAESGSKEAGYIHAALSDAAAAPRGEIVSLLLDARDVKSVAEEELVRKFILPRASPDLASLLKTIAAFERACGIVEEGFDWIRFLSTHAQATPIKADAMAREDRVRELANKLPSTFRTAEQALVVAPLKVQESFAQFSKGFDGVRDGGSFFESILDRHSEVQGAKPPTGKRSWFERAPDGATFVRVPYRLLERPEGERGWNRPYRVAAAVSFLRDLRMAT